MTKLVAAGVDLGGKTTGRTVTAILVGSPDGVPTARLLREDADGRRLPDQVAVRRLAKAIRGQGATIVAVDAPLSLPHAVICPDPDCGRCFPDSGADASYTSRAADRAPAWVEAGFTAHPMPTAMLGALAFRGIYLRRALERAGLTVIETWPRGVFLSLGPSRPGSWPSSSSEPDAYLAMATESLAPHLDLVDQPTDPDDADALAAGLAAWMHTTTEVHRHIGDEEGSICVCTPRPATPQR